MDCQCDVKEMGLQSCRLNKLGKKDSKWKNSKRSWFLSSTCQVDMFSGIQRRFQAVQQKHSIRCDIQLQTRSKSKTN